MKQQLLRLLDIIRGHNFISHSFSFDVNFDMIHAHNQLPASFLTNMAAVLLEVEVDVLLTMGSVTRDSLCTWSLPSSSLMMMTLLSHRSSEFTTSFSSTSLFTGPMTYSWYVALELTLISYFPPASTTVRPDLYAEFPTSTFKENVVWLLISVVSVDMVTIFWRNQPRITWMLN